MLYRHTAISFICRQIANYTLIWKIVWVDTMTAEELLTVVIVAAITSIITTIAAALTRVPLKSFLNWVSYKVRRLRWKKILPKGFPNKDIISMLEHNSVIEILGRRYLVGGFNLITHGKAKSEKRFQFWLIWLENELFENWLKNKKIIDEWIDNGTFKAEVEKGRIAERWLEFKQSESMWAEEIVFLGVLTDPEFWCGTIPEWPEDIVPKEVIRDLKSTQIRVSNIQVKVISRRMETSQVETIWGRWSSWDIPQARMEYHFVDTVATDDKFKELIVAERKFNPFYIRLESYADEGEFGDFSIGVNLKPDDIKLLKVEKQ